MIIILALSSIGDNSGPCRACSREVAHENLPGFPPSGAFGSGQNETFPLCIILYTFALERLPNYAERLVSICELCLDSNVHDEIYISVP